MGGFGQCFAAACGSRRFGYYHIIADIWMLVSRSNGTMVVYCIVAAERYNNYCHDRIGFSFSN
jgi:hypothetical protein